MENKNNEKEPMGIAGVEATQDAGIAAVSKKIMIWTLVAVAVVLLIGGGMYWYHSAGEKKATEAIAAADLETNDSLRFVMYKKLADDGSFKANERAKLMTAIKYYQDGKYKEAIPYLEDASTSSSIVNAGTYALLGDCYVNLKDYDKALKSFNKGLDAADDNPQLVPFLLVKIANVYREQKEYDQEYDIYLSIQKDYPQYLYDIDKYVERARVAAGK